MRAYECERHAVIAGRVRTINPEAEREESGCLENSIFIGRDAPGEHASSVANLRFREFGGLQVIELLIPIFGFCPQTRNLRQSRAKRLEKRGKFKFIICLRIKPRRNFL